MTEPELLILPFSVGTKPPQGFYGYAQRLGAPQRPLVNVTQLVEHALTQTLAAPPTPVETASQQTAPPQTEAETAEKPIIMVVDDSTTLRKILTVKLQNIGFQVVQAQDGQDGLEQLQRNSAVQLVVCDIDMPHMNGFEFLSECRRDPLFAQLPVVMLSTNNDDQHRQLAKTLGANAYFGKPYDEAEFLDSLKSMLD